MVFRQELVADVVDRAPADAQLSKANDHDRHNNDGRVEPEPGGAKPARQDNADRQVAESHRKIASKEAEDVAQVASLCQKSGNKKMH